MLPKLKMDYAMPVGYETKYDSEGRFLIPWGTAKPCPLKANGADEDAMIAALMPTDEEAGMRKVVPDPIQEAADLALAEALAADLSEQMHRLANDTDRKEREELEAMGMLSDENLSVQLRRGR